MMLDVLKAELLRGVRDRNARRAIRRAGDIDKLSAVATQLKLDRKLKTAKKRYPEQSSKLVDALVSEVKLPR